MAKLIIVEFSIVALKTRTNKNTKKKPEEKKSIENQKNLWQISFLSFFNYFSKFTQSLSYFDNDATD